MIENKYEYDETAVNARDIKSGNQVTAPNIDAVDADIDANNVDIAEKLNKASITRIKRTITITLTTKKPPLMVVVVTDESKYNYRNNRQSEKGKYPLIQGHTENVYIGIKDNADTVVEAFEQILKKLKKIIDKLCHRIVSRETLRKRKGAGHLLPCPQGLTCEPFFSCALLQKV